MKGAEEKVTCQKYQFWGNGKKVSRESRKELVLCATDNGGEIALRSDGRMIPLEGEKGTTGEGGFRVPMMVRWPRVIKPGTKCNEIISMFGWFLTQRSAAVLSSKCIWMATISCRT
jgi:arylsulfatase A-like enzyme